MIVFLLMVCTPKVGEDNILTGNTMLRTMNGKYSYAQFDSMCVADTLPRCLCEWECLALKEHESGKIIALYGMMKNATTYRVEETEDDSVKIVKREVK
jgi:hypothetical protein